MKQIILLTSSFLVSSLLASNIQNSFSFSKRIQKKADNRLPGPDGIIYIIIDKSDYELKVFDEKGWYTTYPVVFGNSKLEDKKMEGDRNTPEGTFRITHKRLHDKWYRFMAIDYPNEESREKFRMRKEKGEIPVHARIGGGIGIHGTWPHEDFQIDRYKNWTLGCISMKRDDVDEIYSYAPIGTRVTIRK